jgi:penicillin-binding protein 1A
MRASTVVKVLWKTFAFGIAGLLLFLFSVRINLFNLYGELPGLEVLENPKSELASEVYSSDGKLLGKYYHNFNRTPVEYNELPKIIVDALIATEDVRFYKHSGIDAKGIVSIAPYLLIGKRRGSSTLTQQLAKNLFQLREADDYKGLLKGSVITKIKEWMVALQLEKSYTKKEILLMYLNTVDFGNNSHGIKSAARKYFSKNLDQLKLEEAALLIGLLKGPSFYNPRRNPERALNRRNTVLTQMVKYKYLTKVEYETLAATPLTLRFNADEHNSGLAPHFRAYLKPILRQWCKENGKKLYEDGLKIYTTIDSRMQLYAEKAVKQHMSYLQKEFFAHWKGRAPWTDDEHKELKGFIEKMARRSERYRELKEELGNNEKAIFAAMKKPVKMTVFSWKGDVDTTMSPWDSIQYTLHFLHTGFVSIEPQNGYIRAWVGDIDFKYFKYDHVKQGIRQPGSTFKPLLYAYAMDLKNLTPESQVMDVPQTFTLPDGKTWTPKNSDGKYQNDYLSLRKAMAKSVNTVSAYLLSQVGVDSLVRFSRRMGITSTLDPVPTLCLGTSDVSVYELTSAYGTFINKGVHVPPVSLLRIEDKYGNVLETFNAVSHEVINEQTADYMVDMLKGSVEEEGGTSVSLKSVYKIPGDVGGKTGTTQSSSDGWFIGITPQLVSGVWVGGEERSIRFRNMRLGQGAKMALPIFGYYMQQVYADRSIELKQHFEKPRVVIEELLQDPETDQDYDADDDRSPDWGL